MNREEAKQEARDRDKLFGCGYDLDLIDQIFDQHEQDVKVLKEQRDYYLNRGTKFLGNGKHFRENMGSLVEDEELYEIVVIKKEK